MTGRAVEPNRTSFSLDVDLTWRRIALSGELDLAGVPAVGAAVARLQASGAGDIAVTLDDLTFIDAAGISAVSAARESQWHAGRSLTVTGASTRVRRVFALALCPGTLSD